MPRSAQHKTAHAAQTHRHPRLVSRGDDFRVISIGRRRRLLSDLYVDLLAASWGRTALIMAMIYLLLNTCFALGYLAIGPAILNARPDSFSDAFFFSVQTLATIGYGSMVPQGLAANLLVTLESMFGFAFYGLVTGLIFSKFARPTARILFSEHAVIGPQNGRPHFMLRLANERNNRIVNVSAKLTLMRDEQTPEGITMRRFYDLKLVRNASPLLRLTWTIMHAIDESSPLFGMTHDALEAAEAEIIVSLSGIDETLGQTIHARHSYIAAEIVANAAFEDILTRRENYVLEVNYPNFHKIRLL